MRRGQRHGRTPALLVAAALACALLVSLVEAFLPSACFGPKAVACFDASSLSGATWRDMSGNGNNLTLTGTWNQSVVYSAPSGVYFGGNTFATRATYSPTLAVNFTVMLWMYATTGKL